MWFTVHSMCESLMGNEHSRIVNSWLVHIRMLFGISVFCLPWNWKNECETLKSIFTTQLVVDVHVTWSGLQGCCVLCFSRGMYSSVGIFLTHCDDLGVCWRYSETLTESYVYSLFVGADCKWRSMMCSLDRNGIKNTDPQQCSSWFMV